MPRFRNSVSGVVVSVDTEAAMRLPGSWEPFEGEGSQATPAATKTTRKRSSRKKADSEPEPTSTDDE